MGHCLCLLGLQANLVAICRDISKAVNDQFDHVTLVIRFAAMGYRDSGDPSQFMLCPFIDRPVPASREAALEANSEDAARVSAWVRVPPTCMRSLMVFCFFAFP